MILLHIIHYHTIIVVKEVLDKTKEVLDNAEKTIVVLETAVSGVVDQIKDVKGDIANVMNMFPSLPKLPDGYLLGVIPAGGLKWMDPTNLFLPQTIENKPIEDSAPTNGSEPVEQAEETHHKPPPPQEHPESSDETSVVPPPPPPPQENHHKPPPPQEGAKPPPPQENQKPKSLF